MVTAKERIAELTEAEWAKRPRRERLERGTALFVDCRIDAIEQYLDELASTSAPKASPGNAGSESRDDLSEIAPVESSPGVVAVGRPVASGEILLAHQRAAVPDGEFAEVDEACGCDDVVSLREQLRRSQAETALMRSNVHDARRVAAGVVNAARALRDAPSGPTEARLDLRALDDAIDAYDNDAMPF